MNLESILSYQRILYIFKDKSFGQNIASLPKQEETMHIRRDITMKYVGYGEVWSRKYRMTRTPQYPTICRIWRTPAHPIFAISDIFSSVP